jgi:riboflavin synthase
VRYRFEAPPEFARFIAPKGTVGLDGISLTVNEVMGREFGVNIIPHTQKATTFGELEIGSAVNFEVDMIMRYVERLVSNKA